MTRALSYVVACIFLAFPPTAVTAQPTSAEATDTGSDSSFSAQFIAVADGRTLEIELALPARSENAQAANLAGVILFAHGANLSPDGYRILTRQWANAGYAVVSPVFIDSERHPKREATDRTKILLTRLADFTALTQYVEGDISAQKAAQQPAVDSIVLDIDGLTADTPLFAVGHSYGAYIAQILAGATVVHPQSSEAIGLARPAMLKGVIALSPPPAFPGFSPAGSWTTVATPMLVQTGTGDITPPFVTDWRQHFDSHCEAMTGQSWGAIYTDMDHYFGGTIGRPVAAPSAAGIASINRFATLSLIFMEGAGQEQGLADFVQTSNRLSDNLRVEPGFKCSLAEQ